MAARSPARFLAPLALVAFVVALLVIISSGSGSDPGSRSSVTPEKTSLPAGAAGKHKKHHHRRRTYLVKAGDTPSGIADKTGVPLATLLRLNPDLDPQTLAPGQRIKLRR